MSKIVQAVNAMVSAPDNISKVLRGDDELFFLYRDKYKWSIRQTQEGNYLLWFYPGPQDLAELAATQNDEWQGVDMVHYSDKDIGTKEARASFSELYTIVRERVFGVNDVLDDIIRDLEGTS